MDTSSNVTILTYRNFEAEVIESDVPTLVDFSAEWCGPCQELDPTIEALAAKFKGSAKVTKLFVDDSPLISAQYGIRSIPAILIFHQGKVVDQAVGLVTGEVLSAKLKERIKRSAPRQKLPESVQE